jgi:hypothetical protein
VGISHKLIMIWYLTNMSKNDLDFFRTQLNTTINSVRMASSYEKMGAILKL